MIPFPTKRASIVLAHGKLFTKRAACNLYDIPSGTYDGWIARLKTDKEFKDLYYEQLDKLANEWQGDSVRTLKLGLAATQVAFKNHPFGKVPERSPDVLAWAKAVDSMSKAIKSIGDLTIGTTVLMDDDDDDDDC